MDQHAQQEEARVLERLATDPIAVMVGGEWLKAVEGTYRTTAMDGTTHPIFEVDGLGEVLVFRGAIQAILSLAGTTARLSREVPAYSTLEDARAAANAQQVKGLSQPYQCDTCRVIRRSQKTVTITDELAYHLKFADEDWCTRPFEPGGIRAS
jgi:hypothetical protein